MNISGFGSFTPPAPLGSAEPGATKLGGGAAASAPTSFSSAVRAAVESLDGTQKAAEGEVVRSVTGESTDLHKTIIALQSADLNFQFALQVRNKLIGAYEEIMRMQV